MSLQFVTIPCSATMTSIQIPPWAGGTATIVVGAVDPGSQTLGPTSEVATSRRAQRTFEQKHLRCRPFQLQAKELDDSRRRRLARWDSRRRPAQTLTSRTRPRKRCRMLLVCDPGLGEGTRSNDALLGRVRHTQCRMPSTNRRNPAAAKPHDAKGR